MFSRSLRYSETLASYIPFEYQDGKIDIDISKALWTGVGNAWKQMKPGIDHTIQANKAEKTP